MFKNLNLKNKLLVSFFIITCVSTISTTGFSIYYFSNSMEREILSNMRKYVQIARLIYNNRLLEMQDIAAHLSKHLYDDSTVHVPFETLIANTSKDKINAYLSDYIKKGYIHHVTFLTSELKALKKVTLSSIQLSTEKYQQNNLLTKALNEKKSIAATELVQTSKGRFIAISSASPIFAKDNLSTPIGVILARYILNIDVELAEEIQQLLNVTTAIYQDRRAISFKKYGFIHKPYMENTIYQQMMQQTARHEEFDMRYGGLLSEYETLRDITGNAVAVLGIHASANQYVETINRAVVTFVGIMLVCIMIASVFGYLLAQSILMPIRQLLRGVERITSGDLSYEIIMDLKDEFGVLASSFNSMSGQLNELFKTLEHRVQDATKELQSTLAHMTAIIDNLADGLLVTNLAGKIIRFNPALLTIFPDKKDILNKKCQDMLSTELAQLALEAQKTIGETYTSEISLAKNKVGKAVATAIVQKDALSDRDHKYAGSKCLGSVILIRDITKEKEIDRMLKNTIDTLTRVGTALSSENSLDKLLELCVAEARQLSYADAGTLYTLEEGQLSFAIVQNESMGLFKGSHSPDIQDIPPLLLAEERFATQCVLTKQVIHRRDTHLKDCPKEYDIFRDYSIQEVLVVPMLDRMQEVVGVLQLINPVDPKTKEPSIFTNNQIEIVASLASQAAVAIENARSYEKIERKNIAFKRFVPTEFLQLLGKKEIEEVGLGEAREKYMSVLFSDIRSFTTLSETMTPEDNFHFLDRYLDFIGPCITQNGGFIDKYIGDAIMALFSGSRVSVADDAVMAAVQMIAELKTFNAYYQTLGGEIITIGIGIHTGDLMLGTIGFESRVESTVIGDTVNLASRMEGLTKQYGISVGITSKTVENLQCPQDFLLRQIDTVKVKGKEEAITVYEIFNGDPEPIKTTKLQLLDKYHEALYLYRQGQWHAALRLFSELQIALRQDKVIAIYLKRCYQFMKDPPDQYWAGVTQLVEK